MRSISPIIAAATSVIVLGALGNVHAAHVTKLQVIAAVIAAEARGEGFQGMTAVAQVIRNRGGDPFQQVIKPSQFSCLNKTTPDLLFYAMHEKEGFRDALLIADILLSTPKHKVICREVGKANHYHAKGMKTKPKWAVGRKPICTFCGHIFYVL